MSVIEEDGKINAAGLAFMRDFIGVKRAFRPWNSVATADAIWHFTLGLGDDNPLWTDRDYAGSTAWSGLIAPPTFVSTCATGGTQPGLQISGEVDDLLPGVLGLWANDKWRLYGPTREGMALTATAELYSVQELPDTGGGPRVLQIERQSFYGDGSLLAECDKSILRFERRDSRQHRRLDEYVKPSYSERDREEIRAQYDLEYEQRRGSKPLLASEVDVGDALPRLIKGPLTLSNMAGWLLGWGSQFIQTNRLQHRYLKEHPGALLFDDSFGIDDTIEAPHFNSELARKAGMPAAYDFGVQRSAWLAHMLTDWCGDDGFVTDLDIRLRRPNYLGDTLWLEGFVKQKRHEEQGDFIDCYVKATNQRREVTADGTASVLLGAAGNL
jgi:acyl dehydratase